MLLTQHSLFLRCSLVVVWHFVLLMTETSSLKPREKHPPAAPVDARLVEGGGLCSGRLEMKHRGEWRTMIIKEGGVKTKVRYAQVACRQMGCGSVVSIEYSTNKTDQQPVWEAYLGCSSTESTLKECGRSQTWRRVEGKNTSAFSLEVICSESIRLVGKSDVCQGGVEVKSDQSWVSVCDDGFDSETKKVVCRELGCGPPSTFRGSFHEGGGPVQSKQFQCKGNESRLEECVSSIHSNCTPASGILCSRSHYMRLVGGENHCEGILEAKYDGEWRPLTDQWSDLRLAHFADVCVEVGCAGFISKSRHSLPYRRPVWELSSDCNHGRSSICKHWESGGSQSGISVTCSEAVRLVKGDDRCSGEVEVKSGTSWVPLCYPFFSPQAARVTCRDLACGFPTIRYGKGPKYNFAAEDIWYPVFKCEGEEKHLMDCPSTTLKPTEEELRECSNAFLTCKARPSKPDITIGVMGQPEDMSNRAVIKGHRFAISCSHVSPYSILSFRLKSGDYTGHMATEQIQPSVDGQAIFMFPAAEKAHAGSYKCDYNYNFSSEVFSDTGVIYVNIKEPDYVRLVNEDTRCAGRLEMKHLKEWRPVSYQHSWSLKEAAVLCRQLDCGSAVSTRKVDNLTEPLYAWRFYSDCDGSERSLLDCGTVNKWLSFSTVEVICSDVLLRPKISAISMRRLSVEQQQEEDLLLFKGHSFTINCSVEPQYPGGHFSLIFTGLSQTPSLTLPAVNHSAYFTYSAADETHQGNYRCVYHNFVFNHNFSSESKSLSLILREMEDVSLDDGVLREDDSTVCAGKLFVNHEGDYGLLSAESTVWDLKHASLVCRYLGCGSAVSTKEINLHKKEKVFRFFSDCNGSEASLLDCGAVQMWFSSTAVEVVCTGYQGAAGKS